MAEPTPLSGQLQNWLLRLRSGDQDALDELLRHVSGRLQRLTRQMLKSHPAVKRWAETDDVLQGALMRLVRAVQNVHPDSMREFFALATQQIRWELIDLARHYYGPHGLGANQADPDEEQEEEGPHQDKADLSFEPSSLAEWGEFHRKIDELPDEEREVVGLLFYQGLPQAEAAALLNVTVRTVQRRWHAALVRLHEALKGHWPGS
jgi:RNA polymerase sigma-70 factor (ECF subfamily)